MAGSSRHLEPGSPRPCSPGQDTEPPAQGTACQPQGHSKAARGWGGRAFVSSSPLLLPLLLGQPCSSHSLSWGLSLCGDLQPPSAHTCPRVTCSGRLPAEEAATGTNQPQGSSLAVPTWAPMRGGGPPPPAPKVIPSCSVGRQAVYGVGERSEWGSVTAASMPAGCHVMESWTLVWAWGGLGAGVSSEPQLIRPSQRCGRDRLEEPAQRSPYRRPTVCAPSECHWGAECPSHPGEPPALSPSPGTVVRTRGGEERYCSQRFPFRLTSSVLSLSPRTCPGAPVGRRGCAPSPQPPR